MNQLDVFKDYLAEEEKSQLTQEKYLRDVRKFLSWLGERTLSKQEVLAFKTRLLESYAVASINSMLYS